MIGERHPFVLITYLGLLLGLVTMYLIWVGDSHLAMMTFILLGICDLFDGKFARSFQRTAEQEAFGVEIDSLSDMVNFGAIPILFTFNDRIHPLLILLTGAIYLLATISRLAHFNRLTKGSHPKANYFVGVPSAYIALVLPIVYVLGNLYLPLISDYMLILTLWVMAFLFVWNHRIPKPRGLAYIFFVALALIFLGILGWMQYG